MRGQEDRNFTSNAHFHQAKKTRVIVEETDIGRAGWGNVAKNPGGEECPAGNEGNVVGATRTQRPKLELGLRVRKLYRNELLLWYEDRAHAAAAGSPAARESVVSKPVSSSSE